MAIVGSDFLVVNRGGIDYKAPASELETIVNSYIGDGTLLIKDSDGNIVGTFTANQETETTVTLPQGFTGSWNDLQDKPVIGDAALTIKDSTGTSLAVFTANATADVEVLLPETFSGDWGDLTGKPSVFPPDNSLVDIGLDDLNDVAAAGNEGDFLVKLADGTHGFTALPTPPSLHPMGFIDVSEPAPADPTVGDYYQQHRDDLADAVASANFVGIVGQTAVEGQAVLYGADLQWHLGTSGTPAQKQSDYAQTDVNAVDYIKNKPVIGSGVIDLVDNTTNLSIGNINVNQQNNDTIRIPTFSGDYADLSNKPNIGDGSIQINAGSGLTASGDNATANQAGNTTRTLSLNSGNGLTINGGDGSVEVDLNYLESNLDLFPEAPADGNVYVRNGQTTSWTKGLPYDISTLPELP